MCVYSLNHTTKRVNFGLPKIHRNSTVEGNHSVLRVPHGSAHTPGVSGLCTPAAHLGPRYLWISGAICRAPSTWEATTRKPMSLTEVKHTCFPSALGFKALPRNQAPKHTDHQGAKNPSASSMNTHCQAQQCRLLGRLTSNWQQPKPRHFTEHGASASEGQHPPGSLAYSSAWALSIPALHNIFHQRPQLVRTSVISSWRQLPPTRRSLFSGSCNAVRRKPGAHTRIHASGSVPLLQSHSVHRP